MPNQLDIESGGALTIEDRTASSCDGSQPSDCVSSTISKEAPRHHEVSCATESVPRRPLREVLNHPILNLAPSFWSLCMGTGISSVLLHEFPYPARWLRTTGVIVFILNIALFALLTVGNLIRYTVYKGLFGRVNSHLVSGMFWGCLPMGLATIVNMVAFVCAPWSFAWAKLALALWWIDVVMSVFVNLGMIFMMFARHTHTSSTMTSGWLLPIVSSVVAAASGGVVSQALLPYDPTMSRSVIIVSYAVWGTGVPLALMIIALWIYRTAIEGLPPAPALPSLFLPLGPCGQGAFGIMLLGRVVQSLADDHGIAFAPSKSEAVSLRIAEAVYAIGLTTGLILWGLGLCWYIIGTAITIDHVLKNRNYMSHSSFTIAWTAYTFPLGVWATATNLLASEFDSPAFRVIGAFVSAQVVINWLYVFVLTCWKGSEGKIWVAPELAGYEVKKRFGGSWNT